MRKSTAQKDLAGHTKQLHGPNVAHGPRVGQPWFNGYENNYLLVIHCLKYFFANKCVKKNCASPVKSLTARHWQWGNAIAPHWLVDQNAKSSTLRSETELQKQSGIH